MIIDAFVALAYGVKAPSQSRDYRAKTIAHSSSKMQHTK